MRFEETGALGPTSRPARVLSIEQGGGGTAYVRSDAVTAVVPVADGQTGRPVLGVSAVLGLGFTVLAKCGTNEMAAKVWNVPLTGADS